MRTNILLIVILTSLSAAAREYVVVSNPPGNAVEGGKCILYNEKNDSIGSAVISNSGRVALPAFGFSSVEISAEGCSPQLFSFTRISALQSDTISIKAAVALNEVVITPDNAQDLGNRMSYRIPMADMNRYTNFYQALNEIPHLTVLPTGGAYFEGDSNIKFLLNGVEATVAELKTISKEDIASVEVYSDPPARFAAQGVRTVVDVLTKSNLTGGNFGLDIDQAFYPLIGEEDAALYYNYRRSRFSLLYSGNNTHHKKYRLDENLEYEFDGMEYKKSKKGEDSNFDKDNNNLSLSFQNNKSQNYLYNLKVGMGWSDEGRDAFQKVTSNLYEFDAYNYLKTKYSRYNVTNYFEKYLGEKGKYGTILANVNYQHFDTRYRSTYQEFPVSDNQAVVYNNSAYKTNLDGVFAEIQYEFPTTKAGYFGIALWESYKRSRYVDAVTPFYEKTNSVGGAATWMGRWKKIHWYAQMAVGYQHEATTLMVNKYNKVLPEPNIRLTWVPRRTFSLSAEYSYYSSLPSIAQLSETDQWLDTRLVYHGNALLRPSDSHKANLQAVFNCRYFNGAAYFGYLYSPNMICSQYLTTDKYMLETIVNLDSYRELLGQLTFSVMPLGNNRLYFWTRLIFADVRGENADYSWHGHRFQWMSSLSYNLDKWSFAAFYQFPGKIAEGQLIRPRAETWYVMALFRPISNLSVGLKWQMPFGKSFKESEHTVKDAPVFYENITSFRDGANYVALEFSWNISFGRNRNNAQPQFSNGDNDSGLLKK